MTQQDETPGRIVSLLVLAVALLLPPFARGATTNLFLNESTLSNPTIDATAVVNSGTINYLDSLTFRNYQTYNTHHFTNLASGTLTFDPGFRFETITNNFRQRAGTFFNEGSIRLGNAFFAQFGPSNVFGAPAGGHLNVTATNIINAGIINGGSGGLLRFDAKTLNVSRSLSVIGRPGTIFAGSSGQTNYFNPTATRDIWWAVATNQALAAVSASPLDLPSLATVLASGFPRLPTHEVESAMLGITNVSLPSTISAGSQTHSFIRTANASNVFVTVVVVFTNSLETNITTGVTFAGGGRVPTVEFNFTDVDLITGQLFDNFVSITDQLTQRTNLVLAQELDVLSRKPNNIELFRPSFTTLLGSPSNSVLTNVTLNLGPVTVTFPNIIYNPLFTNSVITNTYAAYGAEIGSLASSTFFPLPPGGNQSLTDPTNFPGRIELFGDNLDISLARLRAESTLIIKTTNLISQTGSLVDAPVIKYDLASAAPTFLLNNFIPATVRRYNGQVFTYSTLWTNTLPAIPLIGLSNDVAFTYNLFMVDASLLRSVQDVDLPSLNIKSTNIVLENRLNASRTFVLDADSVTFNRNNQLFLSFNSTNIPNLTSNNFPTLTSFTNLGTISILNQGVFGSDRPAGWSNMLNRGSIVGVAHTFKVGNLENSGFISASGGPINILAENAKFEAVTNIGVLNAFGSVSFSNNTLKVRNHVLTTSATLNFTVTNLLTDNGPTASNFFTASLGFNLLTRPATADLIGTTLASVTLPNRLVPHVWAGADRGARRTGFSNNAAVGRLVLNPGTNSLLSFRATAPSGVSNALYVDFLELQGFASTNLSNYLTINTNFTLYFATANVPVTNLDGQFGGRLRWVRDFAGPASGVDVVFPGGQSFRVNQALLNSTTLDTDNDGIPNAYDVAPFGGVTINSTVTFVNVPPLTAFISWLGAAQTDYVVEYTTVLQPPDWQILTTVTNNAAVNGTITVQDPLPANAGERYYRVRYSP